MRRLAFNANETLAAMIDAELDRLRMLRPGSSVSIADAIRELIMRGAAAAANLSVDKK